MSDRESARDGKKGLVTERGWRCEECGAEWVQQPQCRLCGNRTRVAGWPRNEVVIQGEGVVDPAAWDPAAFVSDESHARTSSCVKYGCTDLGNGRSAGRDGCYCGHGFWDGRGANPHLSPCPLAAPPLNDPTDPTDGWGYA